MADSHKTFQGPIWQVLPVDGTEPDGQRWCLCDGGLVAVKKADAVKGKLVTIQTKNCRKAA